MTAQGSRRDACTGSVAYLAARAGKAIRMAPILGQHRRTHEALSLFQAGGADREVDSSAQRRSSW